MAIQLTDEQQVVLRARAVTEAGNDAGIEGDPVWSVSDEALLTITPNGFECTVVTNGPLGTATVTVTGDSDLGEGVSEITGEMEVEVIAAPAASIEVTNDEPELKS